MDLYRESMDSYRIVTTNPDFKKVCFVPYEMNPGFVSYRGSQILTLKDSFRIVSHENQSIFEDSPVFTNPTNPYESLVL